MTATLKYAADKLERPYVGCQGRVTRMANPRLFMITFGDAEFCVFADQIDFIEVKV